MGGLALKNTITRTYLKDEFISVTDEVLSRLNKYFTKTYLTKSYHNKPDFGDADIICVVDGTFNVNYIIKKEFPEHNEIFNNGGVVSFDFKELQVDLILCSEKNFESFKTYFSYNDIHNLIGKLFKKFNLKWGQNGLVYVYRIDDKILGEIELTRDYHIAFPMVDLCPKRYEQGFDDLIDIFEYVKSSKFFNPYMFDLHHFNKINRDRDKKRKTYNGMLKYCEQFKNDGKQYYEHDKNKDNYIPYIESYFPGFIKKLNEFKELEKHKRELASKFNGNIIMEITPLKGKELGQFISYFKQYINLEDLRNCDDNLIKSIILKYYNEYKIKERI